MRPSHLLLTLGVALAGCSRRGVVVNRASPPSRGDVHVSPVAVMPNAPAAPRAHTVVPADANAGPCTPVVSGGVRVREIGNDDVVTLAATGTHGVIAATIAPPPAQSDVQEGAYATIESFDAESFGPASRSASASGSIPDNGQDSADHVASFAGLRTFGAVTFAENPYDSTSALALVPASGASRRLPLGEIDSIAGLATAGADDRVIIAAATASHRDAGVLDSTVHAFVVDASAVRSTRLFTGTDPPVGGVYPTTSAPAISLGAHAAAVLWRYGRTLQIALVDPAATVLGPPRIVADGDVGAPTVSWRGDQIVAAWAARESPHDPYRLSLLTWTPDATGSNAPPVAVPLTTGTATAFAPSLSFRADGIGLFAWTEGEGSNLSVRLASGPGAIPDLVATAATLSNAGVTARDPEVAITARSAWIAWTEFPRHAAAQVRVTSLRCAALRFD